MMNYCMIITTHILAKFSKETSTMKLQVRLRQLPRTLDAPHMIRYTHLAHENCTETRKFIKLRFEEQTLPFDWRLRDETLDLSPAAS